MKKILPLLTMLSFTIINANVNITNNFNATAVTTTKYIFNINSKSALQSNIKYNNGYNDSTVQFNAYTNIANTNNKISFVISAYINNQYYYFKNNKNFLSNQYAYVSFGNQSLGQVKLGSIPSILQQVTNFTNTNTASAYKLNAFLNSNYLATNSTGFATEIANKAVSYTSVYKNFSVGLMYQFNNSDSTSNITYNNANKKYGAGAVIGYKVKHKNLLFNSSIGGLQNYFIANNNVLVNNNKSVHNNVVLGKISLETPTLNVSSTVGYYKNLFRVNSTHMAYSIYTDYKLTKITPYVGFSFIHNSNNFNTKRNYLVAGLKYNAGKQTIIAIESVNGLGINNNYSNATIMPYAKHSFNIYLSIFN